MAESEIVDLIIHSLSHCSLLGVKMSAHLQPLPQTLESDPWYIYWSAGYFNVDLCQHARFNPTSKIKTQQGLINCKTIFRLSLSRGCVYGEFSVFYFYPNIRLYWSTDLYNYNACPFCLRKNLVQWDWSTTRKKKKKKKRPKQWQVIWMHESICRHLAWLAHHF